MGKFTRRSRSSANWRVLRAILGKSGCGSAWSFIVEEPGMSGGWRAVRVKTLFDVVVVHRTIARDNRSHMIYQGLN